LVHLVTTVSGGELGSLPTEVTSFVGRRRAAAEVKRVLSQVQVDAGAVKKPGTTDRVCVLNKVVDARPCPPGSPLGPRGIPSGWNRVAPLAERRTGRVGPK
jgi:hypothetical protein